MADTVQSLLKELVGNLSIPARAGEVKVNMDLFGNLDSAAQDIPNRVWWIGSRHWHTFVTDKDVCNFFDPVARIVVVRTGCAGNFLGRLVYTDTFLDPEDRVAPNLVAMVPQPAGFEDRLQVLQEVKAAVAGLPVKGYKAKQPQWKIDLVNANKEIEERALRQIDKHVAPRNDIFRAKGEGYPEGTLNPHEIDQASVQLARRHIEDGFMRLNRAVFGPDRIALPEDEAQVMQGAPHVG